jgi:hypothetical protein
MTRVEAGSAWKARRQPVTSARAVPQCLHEACLLLNIDARLKHWPFPACLAGIYNRFLLQDECVPLFGVVEPRSGGACDKLRLGCHDIHFHAGCDVKNEPALPAVEGEIVHFARLSLSRIEGGLIKVKRSAVISRNLLPYAVRKAPRDVKLGAEG